MLSSLVPPAGCRLWHKEGLIDMRSTTTILGVAGVLTLGLALSAKAEDLTIISKVSMMGKEGRSTTYINAGHVRVTSDDSDTLMDVGSGKTAVVDHKKKEFYEFTGQEVVDAMSRMEAQFKNNPLMEKMLGSVGEVSVQKAGAKRTVAGYSCDPYTLAMGESTAFEICAAPDLQPPAAYLDSMQATYARMGPAGRRFMKLFEEMRKIKGYPVSFEVEMKMMGRRTETLTEAVEIKKGALDASVFALPAGYKKVESPFAKMK